MANKIIKLLISNWQGAVVGGVTAFALATYYTEILQYISITTAAILIGAPAGAYLYGKYKNKIK